MKASLHLLSVGKSELVLLKTTKEDKRNSLKTSGSFQLLNVERKWCYAIKVPFLGDEQ
jgi:hypothetical protein